jgi:tetratricopeptide (TPR) repeat protein
MRILPVLMLVLVVAAGCRKSANDLIAASREQLKVNKVEEAAMNLRKAIQQEPNYGPGYVALSELLIRQGKGMEALQALMLGADKAPQDQELRSRLTDAALTIFLLQQGRSEAVLKRLQALEAQYFKEDPNAFQGHRIHGFLAMVGRKPDEAITSFQKALAAKPNEPEVSAAILRPLMETGKYDEFEKTAKAGLQANPTYGPLYEALSPYYIVTNRIPDAEALLQSRVKADPKNLDAAIALANFYQTTKQPQKMALELERIERDTVSYPGGGLRVAEFHYRSGRLQDAETQAREMLAGGGSGGDRASYERMLLKTLGTEGKPAEVRKLADEILARDPKSPHALTARSMILIEQPTADNLKLAQKDLELLVQLEPGDAYHRFQLGKTLQLLGDRQKATAAYQEAIKLRRTYLSPRMALAEMSFDAGDYPKTVEQVNQILAIDRSNPEPSVLLAAANMGAGNMAQARNILTNVLQQYPNFGLAEVQLGFVYLNQNRLADAEAIFRKYYRQGMPDTRPLRGLIEVNLNQKRADAAVNLVTNEMNVTKYDKRLLRPLLISTAARAGKFDLALTTMREVVKENPKSADTLIRYGELLRAAGRTDEALSQYEEAARLDPANATPLVMAGSVMAEAGRAADAKIRLDKALKLQPNNPLLLNNLAAILADTSQDLPQALQYAQKANQLAQNVPAFKDTLAWVYARMDRHDVALQVLQELSLQDPKNPTILYHRGYVQAKKGLRREARNSLEAALENKPSKAEEQQIRQLLGTLAG